MASFGSKLVPFNLLSSLFWYTHLRQSLLGEPQKQIFGKSWEFGPRRGPLRGRVKENLGLLKILAE